MSDAFYIRLPRNFHFISRLPARFMMEVLASGNQTERGRWFSVRIDGQQLNILARQNLQPGQRLLVEKKSPLELVLVQEAGAKPASEPESRALDTRDHSDYWPAASENQQLLQFLALALLAKEDHRLAAGQRTGSYNFSFALPEGEKLQGVFLKNPAGHYNLFLTLPEQFKTANLESELGKFLYGLPVDEVHLTSPEHVERLGRGINIFS